VVTPFPFFSSLFQPEVSCSLPCPFFCRVRNCDLRRPIAGPRVVTMDPDPLPSSVRLLDKLPGEPFLILPQSPPLLVFPPSLPVVRPLCFRKSSMIKMVWLTFSLHLPVFPPPQFPPQATLHAEAFFSEFRRFRISLFPPPPFLPPALPRPPFPLFFLLFFC